MTAIRIVPSGDAALVAEFDDRIDAAVNARVVALASALAAGAIAGVRDVVPTYRSVAVYFDPLRTDHDALVASIESAAAAPEVIDASSDARPAVRIPVCYGGEFGPDLAAVAAFAGVTEQAAAEIHASVPYRVFMLGFLPGFAYMGEVDSRIAMPRRDTPRAHVPAGSVGIAAGQTGIYPIDSPGGWQIVGRTPLALVDFAQPDPFFLKAGDTVRFFAVTRDEYHRWRSA